MNKQITDAAFEQITLPLADSFQISRGTTEQTEIVTVELRDEAGRTGIGAASPSSYYGETADSVARVLPDLFALLDRVRSPHQQQRLEELLAETAPEQAAARASVSIAVHDLAATQAGEPLFQRLGIDPAKTPRSCFTVAIDSPEAMAQRTRHAIADGHEILKVKLGTDRDRDRLSAVRAAAPDSRIRVDANGDWEPSVAIEHAEWLAEMDIEFIEQPVPAADIDGLASVADASPVPIAADESCVTAGDVPDVASAADIVVVKLMKCGGIRPALRQIMTANAHGLDVMIGCMVESSASIAGSCALAGLAEYADLDGSLLLGEDRYEGVVATDGRVALDSVTTGTGSRPSR